VPDERGEPTPDVADLEMRTDSNSAATDGGSVIASLTPLAQQYLDQTRPWVRFTSVMVFVSTGLMVVLGLVMLLVSIFGGLAAGSREGLGVLGSAVGGGLVALFYLALSASAHTTCSVRTNRVCAANAGVAMVASFIRFLARISKSRPARIVKISPASLAT